MAKRNQNRIASFAVKRYMKGSLERAASRQVVIIPSRPDLVT